MSALLPLMMFEQAAIVLTIYHNFSGFSQCQALGPSDVRSLEMSAFKLKVRLCKLLLRGTKVCGSGREKAASSLLHSQLPNSLGLSQL